jgi:hypothetical protein
MSEGHKLINFIMVDVQFETLVLKVSDGDVSFVAKD